MKLKKKNEFRFKIHGIIKMFLKNILKLLCSPPPPSPTFFPPKKPIVSKQVSLQNANREFKFYLN